MMLRCQCLSITSERFQKLRSNFPRWLQTLHELVPATNKLCRYSTETVYTSTDVVDLCGRPSAVVAASAANTSSIGSTIIITEKTRRWSKVKGGEGTRFTKMMPVKLLASTPTAFALVRLTGSAWPEAR